MKGKLQRMRINEGEELNKTVRRSFTKRLASEGLTFELKKEEQTFVGQRWFQSHFSAL